MAVSSSVTASAWRTEAYGRLNDRLDGVLGAKTAAEFAKLKIGTVGELLLHLPRRYFSGTELSDLSQLEQGEEVAVLAEVLSCRAFNVPGLDGTAAGPSWSSRGKPRLEAVITDHRGRLTLAFFGKPHMVSYWHQQLQPGGRGIFAGKVGEFRSELQLAHPDFVMLSESGQVVGGAKRNEVLTRVTQVPLIGIYPATRKLPTWTIAECVALALDHLGEPSDPLPPAVREAADVIELNRAYHADPPSAAAHRDQGGAGPVALRRSVRHRPDHGGRGRPMRSRMVPSRARGAPAASWTPSTRGCRSP